MPTIPPILGRALPNLTAWVAGNRLSAVTRALIAANRFEKYYFEPLYVCIDGQPVPRPLPPELLDPLPFPTVP